MKVNLCVAERYEEKKGSLVIATRETKPGDQFSGLGKKLNPAGLGSVLLVDAASVTKGQSAHLLPAG
jgi:hypothetical protein